MTPEGLVKRNIKTELIGRGAYVFMPVQSGYGAVTVDFLACVPVLVTPRMVGQRVGVFFGVEAKAIGNEPSKWQEHTMQEIRAAGGVAFPAWSKEHVVAELERWKQE